MIENKKLTSLPFEPLHQVGLTQNATLLQQNSGVRSQNSAVNKALNLASD